MPGTSPRILLVTHTPPWPLDSGGRQRTHHLRRALAEVAEVDFLLLPQGIGGVPSAQIDTLRQRFSLTAYLCPTARGRIGPWRLVRPLAPYVTDGVSTLFGDVSVAYRPDPGIREWIRRRNAEQPYDLIVGRYLRPTARAGALGFVPLILDVDDIDTERARTEFEEARGRPLKRLRLRRNLRRLARVVPPLLRLPSALWVASEADRQRLAQLDPIVLPNIPLVNESAVDPTALPPNSSGEAHTVLIVGSLQYGPNRRGVDRFVHRVWPHVAAEQPGAALRIVGSGLREPWKRVWERVPGVQAVGFVDDLRAEYARCAFTVAPVFEGGGTKIKVLEALTYGRTALVTTHVDEGFAPALKHSDDYWVARTDADMIEGCLALLKNAELRNRLAAHGRTQVTRHYSFDRFRRIVHDTVEKVLQKHLGGVRAHDAF